MARWGHLVLAFALIGGTAACGEEDQAERPGAEEATVAGEPATPGQAGTVEAETATQGSISAEAGGPQESQNYFAPAEPVGATAPPVTQEMLAGAPASTDRWLLYGGGYRNWRHSPIESLNPESVKRLEPAWGFPTGTTGQFSASPTIYGGVMYVTSSYNRLFALDAKTGALLWRYDHPLPADLRLCCGPANRGAAITGDLVIMATLDAKLVALDRTTGELRWQADIAPYDAGYSATSMPLIVGDKAFIGVGGGEFGIRGFFDAYDTATGKLIWRHFNVPDEGEPGAETWAGDSYKTGGAPGWVSGTYDPETDTLFWTTGNPSPDWNGDLRAGDNLYSDSLLAIDPETGERKWHFQFTPHDVWDYDGNTHIFLIDTEIDGERVKAIAQPNRNGFFYVLNRETGEFLRATQYLEQVSWAEGIDADGRPIVNPKAMPQEEPTERICPGALGGMNGAWTGAYNPNTGLVYAPAIEACVLFQKGVVAFVKGVPFMGGLPIQVDGMNGTAYGHLSAIDVATGEIKWRYKADNPMMAGVLSTEGGVVISGRQDGVAIALDAATGEELWSYRVGGAIRSQPVAYVLDGETYVAIPSGGFVDLEVFAGGQTRIPQGGYLTVFKLAGE